MKRDKDFADRSSGNETVRRAVTAVLAWGSWLGALAIFAWSVGAYDRGEAPQWVGLAFVALIGVGVAAGNARAKQALSDTILAAFHAGMAVQEIRTAELREEMRGSHDDA